jgi:predicted porin
MKKSLLAAILAGVVGTATAQTTTIYGVIDTSMQKYSSGSDSLNRPVNNGLNTSFLGFRGTEDLGGGLKVGFILEGQLNASDGTMGSSTPATNEIFNREAALEVSGGFGAVRMGRTDVTAAQNIDFLVSQGRNFGLRPSNGGTSIELGIDQKNVIRYSTPTWNNVTVMVGHASGSANGAVTDVNQDQNGVSVVYSTKKVKLMAGYQKNDGATREAQRDFTALGAAYDFGAASVGYTWGKGDVSTTGVAVNHTHMLTVAVPLKQGYTLITAYSETTDGSQTTANKGQGYLVGMTKTLSPRTSLYTAYTKVDNEANSRMAMNGPTSTPSTRGINTSGIMAGISHSF